MLSVTLSDEQWQKMLPILRSHPNVYVGQEHECQRFLSAVLWLARSGAQWRLLPTEDGYWNAIYRRLLGIHKFCQRTDLVTLKNVNRT
jgi:transposase